MVALSYALFPHREYRREELYKGGVMEFAIAYIGFECSCGTPRTYVKVGISSAGDMVFHWQCVKCGKEVISLIAIDQIIADIPHRPKLLKQQSDADFMRAMGIKEGE